MVLVIEAIYMIQCQILFSLGFLGIVLNFFFKITPRGLLVSLPGLLLLRLFRLHLVRQLRRESIILTERQKGKIDALQVLAVHLKSIFRMIIIIHCQASRFLLRRAQALFLYFSFTTIKYFCQFCRQKERNYIVHQSNLENSQMTNVKLKPFSS